MCLLVKSSRCLKKKWFIWRRSRVTANLDRPPLTPTKIIHQNLWVRRPRSTFDRLTTTKLLCKEREWDSISNKRKGMTRSQLRSRGEQAVQSRLFRRCKNKEVLAVHPLKITKISSFNTDKAIRPFHRHFLAKPTWISKQFTSHMKPPKMP